MAGRSYAELSAEFDAELDAPVMPVVAQAEAEPQAKKRKADQDEPATKKPKVQENRAIYVTNLPVDTNEVEIEEVFKKYGIIDKGADGNARIKMYTDDDGNFNGEALIVYLKRDSIELAIRMIDDYYFRIEDQSNGTISVKEADFSYKRNKDSETVSSKLTRNDRKASERIRADLNRKLAEWSDNEEEVAAAYAPKKNKWGKVVIVKKCFTLEELEEDAEAYLDISGDFHEEGSKHGDVTKVTLFDKEEDGIITVRFRDHESAESFRDASNGRWYSKRVLEASLAQDRPKFKKSHKDEVEVDSD